VEGFKSLNIQPEVYLPTLTDEEKEHLLKKHYVISKQWMIDKSRSFWRQDNYAKPKRDPKNNFWKWNTKEIKQKVMDQNNKCFLCRKEFEENNPPSPDRIDGHLAHTLENIVLACLPSNKARSNQSLELVQTLVQLKQYAIENNYPLVLRNENVIRQLQDAIVGGLSNVWHRSNVEGETCIV
jgi:hypothetical protein